MYLLYILVVRVPYNVFYHRVADTTEWPEISWQPTLQLLRAMSQLNNAQSIQQQGRIKLALQALQYKQFKSTDATTTTFNIPARTLRRRLNRTKGRCNYTPNYKKLTLTKEQTII